MNADRRPGERDGESTSSLARHSQNDTRARQRRDPALVNARRFVVIGTRGVERLVLVVTHCVYCGAAHTHSARPAFVSGVRTASCRRGRYIVQTVEQGAHRA